MPITTPDAYADMLDCVKAHDHALVLLERADAAMRALATLSL